MSVSGAPFVKMGVTHEGQVEVKVGDSFKMRWRT
jgi:hypothetical protein